VSVLTKIIQRVSPLARKILGVDNLAEIKVLRWIGQSLLGRKYPGYILRDRINKELKNCETILEIGAGLFEILKDVSRDKIRVGVEIFMPYIENRVCDSLCVPIHADAMNIDQLFVPRSFDAVMMIDVLEHFNSNDARLLLNKAEAIARHKVIIFVPEGIHPQDKDDRGFGNDYYMTHRSVWYAKDLEQLGYRVEVWKDFHGIPGKEPNNMFCVKEIS